MKEYIEREVVLDAAKRSYDDLQKFWPNCGARMDKEDEHETG